MSKSVTKLAVAGVLACSVSLSHATVCEKVEELADAVRRPSELAGTAGGALKVVGITARRHSSGQWIGAASRGYLKGTIGAIGRGVMLLTHPVTLAVVGVTVVTAGGVVLYCHFSEAEPSDDVIAAVEK